MKNKFLYILTISSLFSVVSCSNKYEPSNITSLNILYNGSSSILEGSSIELNALVNGEIDNSNKFISYTSSNKDIAYVKDNILYTKNVDKTEEVIITLKDKDTKISSSVAFNVLDSGYTINSDVDSVNYSKDNTIITKKDVFNYFYDTNFEKEFVFKQSLKIENFNDESLFGYVLSSVKAFNKDSLLIGLTKNGDGFNIVSYTYDAKVNKFNNLVYKRSYSIDITKDEYIDFSLVRFDQGFRVVVTTSTDQYATSVVKLDSVDFSKLTYCSIYGSKVKLSIKDTAYTYDTNDFIPKPLDIILNKTSAKTLINQTYQIEYALEGEYLEEELLFSSSNEEIATVDEKGLVTAKKGGLATITLQFKGTSIIKHFNLYVYRFNEIYNLDGRDSETFFDGPIGKNCYIFSGNNNNTTCEIYGFRGTFGIYLYVEQYIVNTKNTGNGWYQRDNFEFRISTENKTSYQYYVSVLDNGTTNISDCVISKLETSPVSGYNKFFRTELFLSYDNITQGLKEDVDYNTEFGFSFGVNDAEGWRCNNGFNTTDLTILPKIKEDGIYHSIL